MASPIIPALNGQYAKVWLLQHIDLFDGDSGNPLESYIDREIEAELRSVIHQNYGQVDYFVIYANNGSDDFTLRGYIKNQEVLDIESLSAIPESLNVEILRKIKPLIPSLVANFTKTIEGFCNLRSHFELSHDVNSLNLAPSDFDALRTILLNSDHTEKLSPQFLNLMDLHPATPDITEALGTLA